MPLQHNMEQFNTVKHQWPLDTLFIDNMLAHSGIELYDLAPFSDRESLLMGKLPGLCEQGKMGGGGWIKRAGKNNDGSTRLWRTRHEQSLWLSGGMQLVQ